MTRLTDAEFIELWNTHQSVAKMSRATGLEPRSIHKRRKFLAEKHNVDMRASSQKTTYSPVRPPSELGIENGTVLVFSDAHFWPGLRTTAFQGLLWAIEKLQPKAVICNGDAFDGASISRHPPLGWERVPSVIDELNACKASLGEIEEAAKKARHNVKLMFTMGNHDARFEARLAANAPQYVQTPGFKLSDHFPEWSFCMLTWVTNDVVVKHRYKGGVHATHNNTVGAGKTIVTGHLHSLKVTPYADYNGNRFGVDTGTLAEPYGPQFDYAEGNPLNHRSGFAVLTFKDGELLWPELVHKWTDGQVEFRGEVIDVSSL
jgi:metallophosphoesterase superfamily enzyme